MRTRVLFGILSGALITFGLTMFALFQVFSHHMFIDGIQSPVGVIVSAIPFLLVIAGVVIGVRALRR